ncbi:MAG: T9SS type A sorting domain-containing protein [Crocinitomix sp.]|nr:T9SS type A sorting domain-containing protein [Crocinitomix sp.]
MNKNYTLKHVFLIIAISIVGFVHSQETFTFTNCGATGQDGPDAGAVTAEYAGTTLEGDVTETDGIQYWTVPATGEYSIQVSGAQGGDAGGLGARMYGEFDLVSGQELKLLVGQAGATDDFQHGSGGGGSFVVYSIDDMPLIVAGGGGGHGKGSPGINVNTRGAITEAGQAGGVSGAPGGTGGGGGAAASGLTGGTADTPGADSPGSTWASGGGGFFTEGGACSSGTVPGGRAFVDGGQGGEPAPGADSEGGFGGGGGAGDRGAGGGGYSGGGGGTSNNDGGGGGGSYNDGVNQTNTAGVNPGHGSIIIIQLCLPLTVTVSSEEICLGETFTLDAEGEGVITWDGGVTNGEPFEPDAAGVTTYISSSDDDLDCPFTIDIEVLELPEVTASVDEDEICIGESIVLAGGGADEYTWFPLEIEDGEDYTPGVGEFTYTVIGTDDETGCENTAEVDVAVYDLPEVVATASDEEICLGGSVTLNGEGATTYVWDPEEEDGVEFTPDATGTTTYAVEGTDDNGCVNEAEIDVTVYEALEITFTTTDEILGTDGEIDITVTGGSTPYTYDWDNDGTGDFDDVEDLEGLTCGTYIVVAVCDAGCTASETIEVGCQVGIEELNGLAVSIYPNPTKDNIIIQSPEAFVYSIVTINGKTILNGNGVKNEEISLSEFAKGIYFVHLTIEDQTKTIKVIKQ